ncbi:MAG: hypothetical protein IBJ03_02060 [Gemmatimonadaceae bacterium]|nr:hypothetical protein [Gemmatimonadaceae bacterium]
MSLVSDPSLRSASPPRPRAFDVPEASLPVALESAPAIATKRRRHRWWINGTLALVSSLVALRLLASALASPLEMIEASAAPAWQVEVTTSGNEPGIA